MRILVTGGAGFIGVNLCEELLQKNHYVICLDNISTGSKVNVTKLSKNPNFEFIFHDVIEPFIIYNIDQIYHLASPASPPLYQIDPIKTIKTNILGTLNILDIAKKNNAKILITSTSEIYGNPLINPQSEEYFGNVNTVGPRACYDESKRLCETLMYEYKRMYNLDTKIVRLFNTYGVNMKINDGRVVSNLINQALNNNELTINGDGSQTRSFCYITDTIDGLIKIMNSDLSGPINIGNTDEITINQLSNIILKLTKSKSLIKFKNLPNDDPEMRRPDIKKANKMLEWYPKVNITNGLKMTIEYFSKIQE